MTMSAAISASTHLGLDVPESYTAQFHAPTIVMSVDKVPTSTKFSRFFEIKFGLMFPVSDGCIYIRRSQIDKILDLISTELHGTAIIQPDTPLNLQSFSGRASARWCDSPDESMLPDFMLKAVERMAGRETELKIKNRELKKELRELKKRLEGVEI